MSIQHKDEYDEHDENSKSSEIKYLIAAVDSVDDLYEYEKLSDKIRNQYSYSKSSSLEIGLVPIDDLKSLHLELNENVIHNLDRLTADEILQKIKITSESDINTSSLSKDEFCNALTESLSKISVDKTSTDINESKDDNSNTVHSINSTNENLVKRPLEDDGNSRKERAKLAREIPFDVSNLTYEEYVVKHYEFHRYRYLFDQGLIPPNQGDFRFANGRGHFGRGGRSWGRRGGFFGRR